MSKAFATVNRKILLEELQDILNQDEMYLVSLLTNRPKIRLKVGNTIRKTFDRLVGIMQGDVLFALLFILYLAKCLKLRIRTKMKGFLIHLPHQYFCITPNYGLQHQDMPTTLPFPEHAKLK